MSRIVIDARFWAESGIGRYIRNLLTNLQKIDKNNEYFILLLKKDFDYLKFQGKNFRKVEADFKWYGMSEQIELPRILKSLNPDLVHFPHFNVPLFYRDKYIVTIHDLIHHHFQMKRATTKDPFTYKIKTWGYKQIFTTAVNKSLKIISPSEFVKQQIVEEYKVLEEKIIVTPESVEESIIELSKNKSENIFEKLKQKFQINNPYIYYVGNAHPHKNLQMLIHVFQKIRKQHQNYQLVLSGPSHHFWDQLKKEEESEGVVFTNFVSDEEMVTLFQNATAFVMPSLEEGFGIPVLEAMACSCPVISSNAASLPEVGGSAVIYFNPKDENDMVKKISQVLDDEKLRKELINKGEKRYKEFSWQKMAEQTLKIYNYNKAR